MLKQCSKEVKNTHPHTHIPQTSIKVTQPAKAPRNMRLVAVGPSQSAAPDDRSMQRVAGQDRPVSMRHSTTFDQGKRRPHGPQAAVHAWAPVLLAFASGLGGSWDMEPKKPRHFDLDITKTWLVWSSVGLRDIRSMLAIRPCTCQVIKL
jgi:hypothetical protein